MPTRTTPEPAEPVEPAEPELEIFEPDRFLFGPNGLNRISMSEPNQNEPGPGHPDQGEHWDREIQNEK